MKQATLTGFLFRRLDRWVRRLAAEESMAIEQRREQARMELDGYWLRQRDLLKERYGADVVGLMQARQDLATEIESHKQRARILATYGTWPGLEAFLRTTRS